MDRQSVQVGKFVGKGFAPNEMRCLVSESCTLFLALGQSFKDWARQHDVDELLSEFALAHVQGSATVAACARDDPLEKRRPITQA